VSDFHTLPSFQRLLTSPLDPTSFRAELPLFVPQEPSPLRASTPDLDAFNAFELNTDLVLVAREPAGPPSNAGPAANESDGDVQFDLAGGQTTPEILDGVNQGYTATFLPPTRAAWAPPSTPSQEGGDDEDSEPTSSNEASPLGSCDLRHPYGLSPWEGMTFAEMQDLMDRQKRQFDGPPVRRPAYQPPPNFGDVVREETKHLEEKRARRQKRAAIKAAKKRKDDEKETR